MELHVMTGAFLTGKTTWIGRMLRAADARGLHVSGVYTPAVFAGGLKTGIAAVLLPGGERLGFATRRIADETPAALTPQPARVDAAVSGPSGVDPLGPTPDGRPFSGWDFDDAALERINAHLATCADCDLLVIDELGPLELVRGGGYTRGLALLDAAAVPAALVVVRPSLLEAARERWGVFEELSPASDVDDFLAGIGARTGSGRSPAEGIRN